MAVADFGDWRGGYARGSTPPPASGGPSRVLCYRNCARRAWASQAPTARNVLCNSVRDADCKSAIICGTGCPAEHPPQRVILWRLQTAESGGTHEALRQTSASGEWGVSYRQLHYLQEYPQGTQIQLYQVVVIPEL